MHCNAQADKGWANQDPYKRLRTHTRHKRERTEETDILSPIFFLLFLSFLGESLVLLFVFESRVFIENWSWVSWGYGAGHPGNPWEFPPLYHPLVSCSPVSAFACSDGSRKGSQSRVSRSMRGDAWRSRLRILGQAHVCSGDQHEEVA